MNGGEKLPDWERLWSDLVEEEIRWSTRDGSSSNTDDEENYVIAGKEKIGKGEESHSKSESGKAGKNRDFSKVQCFNCHEHGHYATNCAQNKTNKKA